jgi:hypothetical protein
LVANVYKEFNIFPGDTDCRNVLPIDFFGYDEDGLPAIVKQPQFIRDWNIPQQPAVHYQFDTGVNESS